MKNNPVQRSHSAEIYKKYIGREKPSFKPNKIRIKMPSMMDIDSKKNLFAEFLKVNNIMESDFFDEKDLAYLNHNWEPNTLHLIKQCLEKKLDQFASIKEKFLNEIFENGDSKQRLYQKIFKNIHSYYLMRTLLNVPSYSELSEKNLKSFVNQSKICFNSADMDSILKPVKCRICYSFVPVWLYVEHSNNCFGLNSLKKELLKINNTILGLCENIKAQASEINYEQIVKNKKEALEQINDKNQDKSKINNFFRNSFNLKPNRTTYVPNTSKIDSSFNNVKDNSINKNIAHSKSIFNSYKNENKEGENDPSFTARAKFLKQKTNIFEEIRSVNIKYTGSPNVRKISKEKNDGDSMPSVANKKNDDHNFLSPGFHCGKSNNKLASIHAKKIDCSNDNDNSINSDLSNDRKSPRINNNDNEDEVLIGDMFGDDDLTPNPKDIRYSSPAFGRGFPKKTMTEYKPFKNFFNLDNNELMGYKKVDSQKVAKQQSPEINNKVPAKQTVDENRKLKIGDSKDKDDRNLFDNLSPSESEKGSPYLLKRFDLIEAQNNNLDIESANSKKTQKVKNKGYDMQIEINKIQMSDPDAKKSEKQISHDTDLYFQKVFSFKAQIQSNDESNNGGSKRSGLNLNMFEVQEEHPKTSLHFRRSAEREPKETDHGLTKTAVFPSIKNSFKGVQKPESCFKNEDIISKNKKIKLLDDQSSVSSQDIDITPKDQTKDNVEEEPNISDLIDMKNDSFDKSPTSPNCPNNRTTFHTFGRNSHNFAIKADRCSIFPVKKLSMFPKVNQDDSFNEEESENSSADNKSSNQNSCVGDMFDDAFDNPEPTNTQSTKINTQLLKTTLTNKNKKKKDGSSKKHLDSEAVANGSRNSFTTTVKHSSFYHMHRNSFHNESLNLKDKIYEISQKNSSSNSNSQINDNHDKQVFSIESKDKDKSENKNFMETTPNMRSPPNWISKNISIVKEAGKNNPSAEELHGFHSWIGKNHIERPVNMVSGTSLGFDQSAIKQDHNSSFKPSAGDLSPISRVNNFTNHDENTKENSNNKDFSRFANADITIDKVDNDKSIINDEKKESELVKNPAQPKIFRANSKTNVWKTMHQTSTDYRKVTLKKDDNFDDYYMYLFNKEVQKYKESLLTNPYLENFFADQELVGKIDEYKAKIKKKAYIDTMEALQAAVLERIENIKESRKFQHNIDDINNKSNGRKLVREKFSRSFGNLSVLDMSQEIHQSSNPVSAKNKENLFDKPYPNYSKNSNRPIAKTETLPAPLKQVISTNEAKRVSINVQINHNCQRKESLDLPISSTNLLNNLAIYQNAKQPTVVDVLNIPLKLFSQQSNESPIKILQDEKPTDVKLNKNPTLFKLVTGDFKNPNENTKNENDSANAKPNIQILRRCKSDSDFLIQLEKEKIYLEKTRITSMEDFNILKELGKGAYGKVYLVARKSTQDIFAMKVIKFSEKTSSKFLQTLQNEIQILSVIKGDFLAQAYFSFVQNHCLCIVMEYLVGGDFRELLDREGRFDNRVAKHYIAQLVLALEELHNNKIVHRDLKPENLLLDMEGRLKLADFGLSEFYAKIDENNQEKAPAEGDAKVEPSVAKKIVGTPDYIPPEILFGYEYCESQAKASKGNKNTVNDQEAYTADNQVIDQQSIAPKSNLIINQIQNRATESTNCISNATAVDENEKLANAIDWWAVGCLLYEFCVGVSPFSGMSIEEVFRNIKEYDIGWPSVGYDEDSITPEAKDLIEKLLDRNPKTRLGTQNPAEIKAHPFFAGINWDTMENEKAPLAFNFSLPNKKARVKMSMAFGGHRQLRNDSYMEPEDLTMNRVDLLYEMNIKQFKLLK